MRLEADQLSKENMESWTIRIDAANLQGTTFALQSKGDCYLSANTKLVSVDKAVRLSTEGLARQFCTAVTPTMRSRHGDDVTLAVAHFVESKNRPLDDALVIARIDASNFIPNKRPAGT